MDNCYEVQSAFYWNWGNLTISQYKYSEFEDLKLLCAFWNLATALALVGVCSLLYGSRTAQAYKISHRIANCITWLIVSNKFDKQSRRHKIVNFESTKCRIRIESQIKFTYTSRLSVVLICHSVKYIVEDGSGDDPNSS